MLRRMQFASTSHLYFSFFFYFCQCSKLLIKQGQKWYNSEMLLANIWDTCTIFIDFILFYIFTCSLTPQHQSGIHSVKSMPAFAFTTQRASIWFLTWAPRSFGINKRNEWYFYFTARRVPTMSSVGIAHMKEDEVGAREREDESENKSNEWAVRKRPKN